MSKKKRNRNRNRNNHDGVTMQITPKGVQMMTSMLFYEGWLSFEHLKAVSDALERGWDWNNPVCQKAFADTQPAAAQATDATRSASLALAEKLGHRLTMDEFNSIGIIRGPLYDENETLRAEWRKEVAEYPAAQLPVPIVSEQLFAQAAELYDELCGPDSPGSEERVCVVCAEAAQQQRHPDSKESMALTNRFMALITVLQQQPRVQREERFPSDWIRIAASAYCTMADGFDASLFVWPGEPEVGTSAAA